MPRSEPSSTFHPRGHPWERCARLCSARCLLLICNLRSVAGISARQATGPERAERREPAGHADRQGTAGQEMDGRAAHRQLQRAARQARHKATARDLPACSDRMTRKLLILLCTLGTSGAFAEEISIAPARMARVATIDARFQSYNIEMVEVTGGRFWKPYASSAFDALGQIRLPRADRSDQCAAAKAGRGAGAGLCAGQRHLGQRHLFCGFGPPAIGAAGRIQ